MKKAKAPTSPDQTAAGNSKTAVRGKYFNTLQEHGSNLVIIDPELHKYFPDSESVNKALRAFVATQEHLNPAAQKAQRTDATVHST